MTETQLHCSQAVAPLFMHLVAQSMEREFKKWMKWYGKKYRPFRLDVGDFLEENWKDQIASSTWVPVASRVVSALSVVLHHERDGGFAEETAHAMVLFCSTQAMVLRDVYQAKVIDVTSVALSDKDTSVASAALLHTTMIRLRHQYNERYFWTRALGGRCIIRKLSTKLSHRCGCFTSSWLLCVVLCAQRDFRQQLRVRSRSRPSAQVALRQPQGRLQDRVLESVRTNQLPHQRPQLIG